MPLALLLPLAIPAMQELGKWIEILRKAQAGEQHTPDEMAFVEAEQTAQQERLRRNVEGMA